MTLSLSSITSQFASVTVLNTNFTNIASWSATVLPKSGGVMTGDIDLNGNRLLNVGPPVNPTDVVRLVDLDTGGLDIEDLVPSQTGNAGRFLQTDGTSVLWTPAPGTPGAGISSLTFNNGLSGGTITTTGTVGISNTTVTAASYGAAGSVATFTVNSRGQLTTAATVPIVITKSQVSDLGTIGTMAAAATTSYVPAAGGTFTGVINPTGKGTYVYHDDATLTSGRIIIQALGTAPTMSNGDILLEY